MFLASFFLNLSLPAPGGIYTAVSDVPCMRATFVSTRDFDTVMHWLWNWETPDEMTPRDSIDDQTLWPWEKEEEDRFCGSAKTSPSPPTKKSDLPAHRHDLSH